MMSDEKEKAWAYIFTDSVHNLRHYGITKTDVIEVGYLGSVIRVHSDGVIDDVDMWTAEAMVPVSDGDQSEADPWQCHPNPTVLSNRNKENV